MAISWIFNQRSSLPNNWLAAVLVWTPHKVTPQLIGRQMQYFMRPCDEHATTLCNCLSMHALLGLQQENLWLGACSHFFLMRACKQPRKYVGMHDRIGGIWQTARSYYHEWSNKLCNARFRNSSVHVILMVFCFSLSSGNYFVDDLEDTRNRKSNSWILSI